MVNCRIMLHRSELERSRRSALAPLRNHNADDSSHKRKATDTDVAELLSQSQSAHRRYLRLAKSSSCPTNVVCAYAVTASGIVADDES